MQNEYITDAAELQEDEPEMLADTSSTGKARPWAEHHRGSQTLAAIYSYMADAAEALAASEMADIRAAEIEQLAASLDNIPIDYDKLVPQQVPDAAARYRAYSQRLTSCAPWVVMEQDTTGAQRLQSSIFCRVRLCPMCQWRRSLKLAGQARQVVTEAQRRQAAAGAKPWRWLMLTVTVRNVPADELSQTIDHMHNSLHRLTKRKQWPAAGWLRATEITYNAKHDTYHPHMHLLLCVPPSYYSGRAYMSQATWAALWKQVARLDYTPVVDVRAIKPRQGGDDIGPAIAEVAKYGAKPADYIRPGDIDTSMRVIGTLTDYLDGRRLTSWGGILKTYAAALKLDDPETGDLVHIVDEPGDADGNLIHNYIMYHWAEGWGNYAQLDTWQDIPSWQQAAKRRAAKADYLRTMSEKQWAEYEIDADIAQTMKEADHEKEQEIPRPIDKNSSARAEQTCLYEMGGDNTGRT